MKIGGMAVVFLLFALSVLLPVLLFAPPYSDNDVDLYRLASSFPSLRIINDFDYTYGQTISTSSSNFIAGGTASSLSSNAIICPGTISVTTGLNGTFASSTFDAVVPYWYECIPSDHSLTHNIPIHWSQDGYDTYVDLINYCGLGEPCWGSEGFLTAQQVDYDRGAGFTPPSYPGKRASVTTICTGRNSIDLYRGGSPVSTTPDSTTDGSVSTTQYTASRTMTVSEGINQVRSQFFIEGCLIISRTPECSVTPDNQVEHVYSRTAVTPGTSGGPRYSFTIPLQTKNLDVRDIQYSANDISTTPSTTPASPICMGTPGETRDIETVYENTGDSNDARVRVTGVGASDGFTAAGTCSGVMAGVCRFFGASDGYNAETDIGDSTTLSTVLTAPGRLAPGVHSVTLTYTYEPLENVCTSVTSKTFTTTVYVNTTPGCGTTPPAGPVNSCSVDPASADVPRGASQDFNLRCFDGEDFVSCAGMEWVPEDQLNATISRFNSSFARMQFNTENVSGLVIANWEGASCNSTVNALPAATPSGGFSGCFLSPRVATVERDAVRALDVRCVNNGTVVPCSDGRGRSVWTATPALGADFLLRSPDRALVRFSSENVSGTVRTTTPAGYACISDIRTVPATSAPGGNTSNLSTGCTLSPSDVIAERGVPRSFAVSCVRDGAPVSCTEGNDTSDWTATPRLGASFISDSADGALVSFLNENTSGILRTTTPAGYICDSSVRVVPPGGMGANTTGGNLTRGNETCPGGGAPPCDGEPTDQICTLRPTVRLMSPGQQATFMLSCSDEIGGREGQCSGVDWEIAPFLTPLGPERNTGVRVEAQPLAPDTPSEDGYVIARTREGACHAHVQVENFACRQIV